MVEFGGWQMPLEYTGITDEHLAVRTRVGVFDVSHMGEVEVAGTGALDAIQWLCCNDASRLDIGQAQYSALTTTSGGVVDDVLVYRLGAEHFLLVVNAANIEKDAAWMTTHVAEQGFDAAVVNSSSRYGLIGLQGPQAAAVLGDLTDVDLQSLKYYRFSHGEVAGVRATVSRTGYTGEDGFEIMVPTPQSVRLWDAILSAGRTAEIRACGLGARDTLRLEACMRLYGNEMDENISVLEAGLGRFVGWDKADFLGAAALRSQKAVGVARQLVAFEMIDRAIARHGATVVQEGRAVGSVTSGTQTPFLRKAIGLAMVPSELARLGTELVIDVRGRQARARVVPEPFYKRPKPAPVL
jgi:aminomethyltransferase